MPEIRWGKKFSHKLEKFLSLHPEMTEKLYDRLKILKQTPEAPILNNHKLIGSLSDHRAVTIAYDCRLIFWVAPDTGDFILVDIGSHDDVY